jgi:hypothetical protein
MALPIRQNFSMNIFSPDERSRGSSITGFLFSIGMFSLAFLSAGLISTIDPILYYLFFKNTEKN